ncbi:MAG: polyphosphate:AMP phosphotransferase [Planctomycetota bacterium]|jgi:polyphosphate:AMP phosphotransferase
MSFSTAEQGNRLSKDEYSELEPGLRVDLVNAQYDMRDRGFPVLVTILGDDGPGCEEVLDLLNEWMDARYMETHVFLEPSSEEIERPRFWRFWRALPPYGRTALFAGGWALHALADVVTGKIKPKEYLRRVERIRAFERELRDDGAVHLKIWLHLPKAEARKRIKKARKEPEKKGWRLEADDYAVYKHYDELIPVAEDYIERTGGWAVVESTDREYRNVAVARLVLDAIRGRLETKPTPRAVALPPFSGDPPLDSIDLGRSLDPDDYKERLGEAQRTLRKLALKASRKGVSTVLAFEGSDAAGKGGSIRRITQALPARLYRVIPIAAPTDEEQAHHYLWRFWRRLPRAGNILIFDRTWYGRVLVERVEGFASDPEWKRAYAEINDFESQIVGHGSAFAKFWLQIDPDEQLRRFQAREQTNYKKYKITDEDYRNREKGEAYTAAINEMVARTSTDDAPWNLVPANDKRWARVQVIDAVIAALKARL